MVIKGPSPSHEKTKLVTGLEGLYGAFDTKTVLHSSADTIKEHLLSHIAYINPDLAKEMMRSQTEGSVLAIIGKVEKISNTVGAVNENWSQQPLEA